MHADARSCGAAGSATRGQVAIARELNVEIAQFLSQKDVANTMADGYLADLQFGRAWERVSICSLQLSLHTHCAQLTFAAIAATCVQRQPPPLPEKKRASFRASRRASRV